MNDSSRQASALMNLGTEYIKIDYAKAMNYYNNAMVLLPNAHFSYLKMKLEYNIAEAHLSQKEYDLAGKVFSTMLELCIQNNQLEGIAMAHKGLAEVFKEKGLVKQSIIHYNKAIALLDSLGMQFSTLALLRPLVELYKNTSDYKTSLVLTEKLLMLNDSILSKEKVLAVKELETKYQTEKKQIENNDLRKDAKIKKYSIGVLIFIALVLFLMFKQRTNLLKQRAYAYDVLIEKYKQEKLEREKAEQKVIIEEACIVEKSPKITPLTIYEKLVHYYQSEKPYLNSRLKVDDISKIFNVSQKEIAADLKANANVNFTSFTNKYRVEEARIQFEDPKYQNIKMEVIAEQAGFGTIQSFYNAFELYTGVKPAFYRSKMLAAINDKV
jgi:AraC-like DNA-binding protein